MKPITQRQFDVVLNTLKRSGKPAAWDKLKETLDARGWLDKEPKIIDAIWCDVMEVFMYQLV